jgi:hypothetical protein
MPASEGTSEPGRIDKISAPHFISTPLNNHPLLRTKLLIKSFKFGAKPFPSSWHLVLNNIHIELNKTFYYIHKVFLTNFN